MVHYNIAKKQEINPFENVNYVRLAEYSEAKNILENMLANKSDSVETRKLDTRWAILYNVEHLDFTTLVSWMTPNRGKFQFRNKWVHFSIEEDTMVCW